MKKKFIALMILAALSLTACGGGAQKSSEAPAVQSSNTEVSQEKSSEESAAATEAPKESQSEAASSEEVPREYISALNKAQSYSDMMHMSKNGLYDQLTSEYGEKFPAEAAKYAVEHVKADFKLNALEKAKTYQKTMNMSSSAIYDQLISEHGEKFTEEEAKYAVDNLPK